MISSSSCRKIGGLHRCATPRSGVSALMLVLLGGCATVPPTADADGPASAPANRIEAKQLVPATFEDRSEQAGVDDVLKHTYAHAAAWGDVNGDGYPDLYWGAWVDQGPDYVLINNGDGTFKDTPQESINRTDGRASGSVFVDLDNDGDNDLIIVNNWRKNAPAGVQLLQNDGKGNFTDVTANSGLALPNFSGRNPFIIDYDGDGLLDVLIQHDMWGGQAGSKRSFLLRSRGGMKFEDVTAKAGLPAEDGVLVGLGGAVGDVNGDGWQDFVHMGGDMKNQLRPDVRLYLNNKNGTFSHATNFDFNKTFPYFDNGEDWICGAGIGDLNNDGRMDLVLGVHYGSSVEKDAEKRQAMAVRAYLNQGNDAAGKPSWQDITGASGIQALFIKQPNVEIQDFNNDGRMDIWNGTTMRHTASGKQMPYIQYNLGNDAKGIPAFTPAPGLSDPKTFEGYTPDKKALINPRYYAASPTADYDRDGKLDIFGADWATGAPGNNDSGLLHNTTQNIGNYLTVQIDTGAGTANRFGVGARVSVYAAGQAGVPAALLGTQLIEIGNGYCSGRPATAHFGVPGRDAVDVVVQLPSGGATLTSANAKTNQFLTVTK